MTDLRLAGQEAAASGPCLPEEVDRARDQATLASMAWALRAMGGDRPGEAAGLVPAAQSIVRRWLEELSTAGWVDEAGAWLRTPPHDVTSAWDAALALAPEPRAGGALTRFFANCAHALPEILTGEVQVQSLLFDDDAVAEEIYQANEASRYTNTVAAHAVRERCLEVTTEGRTPVAVEIGGGIGGTTDVVLEQLTDLAVRYHFTDVGEWFTSRAVERWAGRAGLTTGSLDINAAAEEQHTALGELNGKVDVVLAANVMHNALDVPAALQTLAALCRPAARLVLIETGTEHLPLLISMRFLMTPPPPGEGIGGDRGTHDRILMSTPDWSRVIDTGSWQLADVLPGPDSDLSVARYDQHVWLADRV